MRLGRRGRRRRREHAPSPPAAMASFPPHRYGSHRDADPRPQAPLHLHELPVGHGPASSSTRISTVHPLSSLAHAPAFVRSTGTYDELGRSIRDGVRADVVDGIAAQGSAKSSGEALAFWKGLQLHGASSRTGSPSSTPPLNAVTSGSTLSSSAAPTAPSTSTIVVPRDQWFIRRALLAKAAKERERDESGDATPVNGEVTSTSTPPPRPAAPSLATLLAADLAPPDTVEGYQPPAYFHLRENNRGWQVLKKIGWDGQGGLGRQEGVVETGQSEGKEVKREDDAPIAARTTTTRGHTPTGESRESAIDLTLDSASSSSDTDSSRAVSPRASPPEKFGEGYIMPRPSSPRHAGGSGRTAPVATYLKTDLRGIGALPSTARQRTLLRPSTLAAPQHADGKRKRVTHSVEDVRAAVRDAREAGDGLTGEERVAWERKRAKRDGERDRRERQRWREIINRG